MPTNHNRLRPFLVLGLPVALLLLPLGTTGAGGSYWVSLVNHAVIYALAALSLDFVMGYGRMPSLGHAAFFGLGAYTVAILSTSFADAAPILAGWNGSNDALVLWPLAMLVGGAYALLVGALSIRTKGVFFIMITLAFGQMAYFFFSSLSKYGGLTGLSIWSHNTIGGSNILANSTYLYYICLGILLAAWWMLSRITHSRFGRVLQGCRENERRMRALGYHTYLYKLTAFVISGALAGLAGGMTATQSGFVSPALLQWTQSGDFFIMVLLGGVGSLIGPIYGAIILLMLQQALVTVTASWQIILGLILVLVALFLPGGLYGRLTRRGK